MDGEHKFLDGLGDDKVLHLLGNDELWEDILHLDVVILDI